MAASPQQQLDRFIDRFTPEIAEAARAALRKMRARLPNAHMLVYDNYNALVIGFGPNEKASEAIFSIALYPKWVTLFFLQGAKLKDAKAILDGAGARVRQIRLVDLALLDNPDVIALMLQAQKKAAVALDPSVTGQLVIKSISPNRRPRRPPRKKR